MGKRWIAAGLGMALFAAVVMPITAAAVTNTEVLAILGDTTQAIIQAGRDAYCAMGVTPLCP